MINTIRLIITLCIFLVFIVSCIEKPTQLELDLEDCIYYDKTQTFSLSELRRIFVTDSSKLTEIHQPIQNNNGIDSLYFGIDENNRYTFVYRKEVKFPDMGVFYYDTFDYYDSGTINILSESEPYYQSQTNSLLFYDYDYEMISDDGYVQHYSLTRFCENLNFHYRRRLQGDSLRIVFSQE